MARRCLDLDYNQDVDAEVDMNVVMTGSGRFVEIQGTGEEATFGDDDLAALIKLAKSGIRELRELQKRRLPWRRAWPFRHCYERGRIISRRMAEVA